MNFFQRRIAFLLFLSLLVKAASPSASWAQVGMFGGLAFAMWQLRSAVFRACMERLLSPLIFYFCDSLCVALLFVSYQIIFFDPLHLAFPVIGGFLISLLTAYRYRKQLRFVRSVMEGKQ